MQIIVRDNNVDQALRALKKKLQREGVYREMKLRRHYEKPSEKRARERAARSAAPASWSASGPSATGSAKAQPRSPELASSRAS
jgi:small subunit ribosomal protein S21